MINFHAFAWLLNTKNCNSNLDYELYICYASTLFAEQRLNYMLLQSEQLKQLLKILDDNQAIDVVTIDVSKQTTVTDYMVIASGRSSRQVKAIASIAMENMKEAGTVALGAHGLDSADWVLIDFGDCVLHVFQPDSRAFYNLEGLWQDNYETK